MAARYLPPHDFLCLTDAPVEGVDCQPLECEWPSWWSKLSLFRPGALPGENFYLDLDVVLTAPVVLPTLDGRLWALDDFSYSLLRPRQDVDPWTRRLLGGSGTINSSVMYWRDDAGAKVWNDFKPEVMRELHGDQNWITRCLWPDRISLFPPGFACSFKYHVQRGQPTAPIVVFHGQPKAHELERSNPLRQAWEAAA